MDDGARLAYNPTPKWIVSGGWKLGRWGLGESLRKGAVQPERRVVSFLGSQHRELQSTKRKTKRCIKQKTKKKIEIKKEGVQGERRT